MGFSVSLLGPLEVRCDGVPVAEPVGRQRTVLAMLMLDPRHTVSRAGLTAELYGDNPPPSAAANLRTYVSGLRRWLADSTRATWADRTGEAPPGDLLAHGDGGRWSLSLTGCDLDVDAFEQDRAEGRAAIRRGDPQMARQPFGRAVGAFRGVPLQDVAKGAVLAARATVLMNQQLAAVEEYADVLLHLGEYARAQELLVGSLSAHPTRERAWCQLMLAYYRGGDVAAALAGYKTARSALRDLIGMDPGDDLTGLHRQILRRDPSLLPVPRPDRGRLHAVSPQAVGYPGHVD